jgi:putative protein-disulfide isomerase
MCSWCWGFRPTWKEIQAGLSKDIEVKYLLGGLAPDSKEVMPKAMQEDIAGYWKKIQQHIPNTKFNFDFWEQCEPRRSTYPACRAVIAAKKQNTGTEKNIIEKQMVDAIQTAYYLNAKNPSDDETLIAIADTLGLDIAQFSRDLNSDETQQQLMKEIQFGQSIGARGFPSMILDMGGAYQYVPLNYNDAIPALDFIHQIESD